MVTWGSAYVGLEATVAEHLHDLGVFLTIFLEGELTLLVVVLVLSTTSVLSSLLITRVSMVPPKCLVDVGSLSHRHP